MSRPLVLFAHGAGIPSTHPWMTGWRDRLATLGDVVTFDYPYVRAGRRAPDRLPTLLAAHREALAEARAAHEGPIWLAGKSMGSRVGCHLALEAEVAGLICFGYPLVGASGAVRDEVLLALRRPILFVQGTADRLCPLDRLAQVRAGMVARSELFVVERGDHSLLLTPKAQRELGTTQADSDAAVLRVVGAFVARA